MHSTDQVMIPRGQESLCTADPWALKSQSHGGKR